MEWLHQTKMLTHKVNHRICYIDFPVSRIQTYSSIYMELKFTKSENRFDMIRQCILCLSYIGAIVQARFAFAMAVLPTDYKDCLS